MIDVLSWGVYLLVFRSFLLFSAWLLGAMEFIYRFALNARESDVLGYRGAFAGLDKGTCFS